MNIPPYAFGTAIILTSTAIFICLACEEISAWLKRTGSLPVAAMLTGASVLGVWLTYILIKVAYMN